MRKLRQYRQNSVSGMSIWQQRLVFELFHMFNPTFWKYLPSQNILFTLENISKVFRRSRNMIRDEIMPLKLCYLPLIPIQANGGISYKCIISGLTAVFDRPYHGDYSTAVFRHVQCNLSELDATFWAKITMFFSFTLLSH